jgi:hypothetical protein
MTKVNPAIHCRHCGEIMEDGCLVGTIDASFVFVVPGNPTSINPVTAFQQGLKGDRTNEAYRLQGYRCPGCGSVELMATEKVPWSP